MKTEYQLWLILAGIISFALSVGVNITYIMGELPAGESTWQVIGYVSTGVFFISLFLADHSKKALNTNA